MSIRLLMSVLIAGVHYGVDGATLSLSAPLESDLVGQGKAVWVTPPSVRTDLVDHAAEHAAMGAPLFECGMPFILFAVYASIKYGGTKLQDMQKGKYIKIILQSL